MRGDSAHCGRGVLSEQTDGSKRSPVAYRVDSRNTRHTTCELHNHQARCFFLAAMNGRTPAQRSMPLSISHLSPARREHHLRFAACKDVKATSLLRLHLVGHGRGGYLQLSLKLSDLTGCAAGISSHNDATGDCSRRPHRNCWRKTQREIHINRPAIAGFRTTASAWPQIVTRAWQNPEFADTVFQITVQFRRREAAPRSDRHA